MRTSNEIHRTSFERLPHRKHIICICCKAGSLFPDGSMAGIEPARVLDKSELNDYEDYYKGTKFKVYKCFSCGYQFSEFEKE